MKVYLAFSGGKDTLCMCNLIYELAMKGEINPKLLTVIFIDEEALYESMFQMALRWRKKFTALGAQFRWYCLPVYQVSMLHHLADDESWVTWEPGKESVWIRQPPPFAILRDPAIEYSGQMNYQTFLPKVCKDGIMLVGVRASESVQRVKYLSAVNMTAGHTTGNNIIYPIYDWKDSDVWLYIKERRLDFPQAYIDLYRVGVKKSQLRLCNFFASESIAGLRYGTVILYTVLTAVFGYLGILAKRLAEKYLNSKEKKAVAASCVKFVEQVYKDLHGEEKLEKALEAASEMLAEKGIQCTELELRVLIEAALASFNDAFNKDSEEDETTILPETEPIDDFRGTDEDLSDVENTITE